VGDDTHLTFFEMLGNWSLGDYWKKESINWSFEFLTKELGIAAERISITCFEGDSADNIPRDDESAEIWKSFGIPEDKIKFLGREDNWWGPAGKTGPCGPDTEIFVDGIEIWNNVFMEYNKTADGKYEPLEQKNVDTGMGLERTLMILNNQKSVFETDLFEGLIREDTKAERVKTDHIKAAIFIISEDIEPSNTGAGYVLRRLIRRAVRYGADFNIAEKIIEIYKNVYPELLKNKEIILNNLKKEKEKFDKTLEQGMKEFEKGIDPFTLFTSYGFPFELTKELAKEKGIEIDEKRFNEELKKHQELSRTSSAGMFKGGLSDAGEETKKLHTATHLLRQALEIVLGEPIMQKGSNITPERLRFDFNRSEKISEEQLKKVEDLVNEKIKEGIPVEMLELPKEEALKVVGTLSFDLSKYGDVVKIYKIGDFSVEFCGGPHVSNTSELGHFKIIKEESVSAGIRRIKAILE
jgi:alanyl-tRNA synthetase